jgi:phage N-6-adenine-methyltransferase
MTQPIQKPGRSNQSYATPDDFFAAVVKRFGKPVWDLAASADNTKATGFYSIEQDSLRQCWAALPKGWLWCNPPFADIEPWVEQAHGESLDGAKILMLVPAGVGTNWFKNWVFEKAWVLFLSPRLTFKGCDDPYPKDLMLLAFDRAWKVGPIHCWRWDGK